MAVIQYEHFRPEFADATTHDPDGITLLCGACHDRKTRRLLSVETVTAGNANPVCKREGFSFGPFDLGVASTPEITIGTVAAKSVTSVLRIYGDSVMSVRAPETPGAPFLINAFLCDSDGREVLNIVDNEWRTRSDNWDVEVVGPRITVRRALGDVVLQLRSEPPHRLVVERLDMVHRGVSVHCQEGRDLVVDTGRARMSASGMRVENCLVGIDVTGQGLLCGVGGGSVMVDQMTFGSSQGSPAERSLAGPGPVSRLASELQRIYPRW